MADYDVSTFAGEGAHCFSDRLMRLSTFVGIPPPTFHGKMLYKEHGTEKWKIKTVIPGRTSDPHDMALEYTVEYPDWYHSVEMAMQGAIARVCHKYHEFIPRTSPYYLFGERSEDGDPIDRSDTEYVSLVHSYLTEREYGTVCMENLLEKQLSLMDEYRMVLQHCNTRIVEAETAVLVLADKKDALEARIQLLEEPRKLEEKLLESDTWNGILNKTMKKMLENREVERNKRIQLEKENEELKKKIAELTAAQKEEEEPEEKIMITSDGEEMPIEEWKAREASKKLKRRNTTTLACYDRVKRR